MAGEGGTATVRCIRCGRADAPALARPPLPGSLGREIQARNCADCWAEWTRVEVMVINELRLNFMDPAAQEVLNRHMREFLDPSLRQPPAEQAEAAKPPEPARHPHQPEPPDQAQPPNPLEPPEKR